MCVCWWPSHVFLAARSWSTVEHSCSQNSLRQLPPACLLEAFAQRRMVHGEKHVTCSAFFVDLMIRPDSLQAVLKGMWISSCIIGHDLRVSGC
jgi:hypothetical protein